MRRQEIKRLTESTSDPVFAVDGAGLLVAWNRAAEEFFGLAADEVLGQPCGEVLCGADECGAVCMEECVVRRAAGQLRPLHNFDMQVATARGRQWCNFSVLRAEEDRSVNPYTIHIVRPVDLQKRLDVVLRDFVRREMAAPETQEEVSLPPAHAAGLTPREREILRLAARGAVTAGIAAQLNISPTTVSNHFQHILRKLGAHSRLAAIRRAEHAGLI